MSYGIKYRFEIDYYDKDTNDAALLISSPCKTIEDLANEFDKYRSEKCIDNKSMLCHIKILQYYKDGLLEIWNNEPYRNNNTFIGELMYDESTDKIYFI